MATTLTQAIHKNQKPNETMTQCLARLRDPDETMTHEARDLAIIADGGGPVIPPVVTKPSKPTGVTAGTPTADSIAFTWAKTPKADKYTVNVAPAVTGYPKDVTTEAAALTGLTAATEYTLSVKACNTAGCSADTTAKTTTAASAVVNKPPVTAPKATTPKPKVP